MKHVLVVFGGRSAEHDVSIVTAHIPIIDALRASGRYVIHPLYIARSGKWYVDDRFLNLEMFRRRDLDDVLERLTPVRLLFEDGLQLVQPRLLGEERTRIDVVFPSLHGTYGEDGSLMGLLRMANVPFVGCDMDASVIAMDKVLTKQVLAANDIPIVPFTWLTARTWANDPARIRREAKQLGYPAFVKPVHLGSSIAITRVETEAELDNAVEVALHYDNKVLVEPAVPNLIEVTLPIIGNDELQLAEVEQPLATFFTFEEKYLKGGKKGSSGGGVNTQYSHIPAKISPTLMRQVRDLGQRSYRAIGATGIARIDFLIDSKKQQIYVNEINTLPGSLYHHNWRAAGVSAVELVDRLIELALERYRQKQSLTATFASSILDQVGGSKRQAE